MADEAKIQPHPTETKGRTPEQELAAGFLEPFRIAERRRRREAGKSLLQLLQDGEEAA